MRRCLSPTKIQLLIQIVYAEKVKRNVFLSGQIYGDKQRVFLLRHLRKMKKKTKTKKKRFRVRRTSDLMPRASMLFTPSIKYLATLFFSNELFFRWFSFPTNSVDTREEEKKTTKSKKNFLDVTNKAERNEILVENVVEFFVEVHFRLLLMTSRC